MPGAQIEAVTIDANNYTAATKLLFGGSSDYAVATRIFSSYHADATKFFKDPISGVIHAERGKRRAQYAALEALLGADSEEFSSLLGLVGLFCGPVLRLPEADSIGSWSETIHDIVQRAKRKNDRIRYQLITRLARDLYETFNASTGTLPDTWRFPWGDVPQSRACVAALHALCAYHLLSIHFGSKKKNLMGWGMNQICLTLDTADLIRELARISGIETSLVAPVVVALTWGANIDAPDPALQPLIPVGRQKLAVPGILILSSNWARNMLSLHARVSQSTFDASSSVFEERMIESLTAEIPALIQVRANVRLPTSPKSEEFDLVLIDPGNQTVLLCELRWMIPPGDIREVLNREKVIEGKVIQACRKLRYAVAAAPKIKESLNLDPTLDWSFRALVVVDGFGGIPSIQPNEIPVVPKRVFTVMMKMVQNLEYVHALLCSPLWLPRDGMDHEHSSDVKEICGVKFSLPSISIGGRSYIRNLLPTYISEGLSLTPTILRSMSW